MNNIQQFKKYSKNQTHKSTVSGGIAITLQDESGLTLGTLWAYWQNQKQGPEETLLADIRKIAATASVAIKNAQRFQEACQLADLDPLTNLYNHRFFHETLERETARAQRYARNLALVIFDIDDFKKINDGIGHLAGDAVLARTASCVQTVVRSSDTASRVGGDEFAVILPESSLTDAENFYRRLHRALEDSQVGQTQVKLSVGIAQLRPDDKSESFYKRADMALYEAKRRGKNQAVAARSTEESLPPGPSEKPNKVTGFH